MRWPWQWRTTPGMVWVKDKDLVATLRDALRAGELEAEIRESEKRTASAKAEAHALKLLSEQRHVLGGDVGEVVRSEVLQSLPLAADGTLHEPAFVAWVSDRVWADRARALEAMTGR